MAEKISGLIALGEIAMLLCVFVPAATYLIYRAMSRRQQSGYGGGDVVALLIAVTTLGAMLYIVVDAQQLYPRCGMYDENHKRLCFVDRYDTTGSVYAVSNGQAAVRMGLDLLVDVALCIIIPSILGVILLFRLGHATPGVQHDRTSDAQA